MMADLPDVAADPPTLSGVLVIDELDDAAGLAEVEDGAGRTFQLPAEWLPGAQDGAAYRVAVSMGASGGVVSFTPDAGGAALLRERSKQTLLDFSDEPQSEGPQGSDELEGMETGRGQGG